MPYLLTTPRNRTLLAQVVVQAEVVDVDAAEAEGEDAVEEEADSKLGHSIVEKRSSMSGFELCMSASYILWIACALSHFA